MASALTLERPSAAPARSVSWRVHKKTDQAVIVRRDGSPEPEERGWEDRLEDVLRTLHNVGVVGAKQLMHDASSRVRIHAMGDFVIHSKGFHHIGRGLEVEAHGFLEEVDCVSGGVMAIDRDLFEGLGGQARFEGELGAVTFCLAARARGKRVLVTPSVVVLDAFTPAPAEEGSRRFRDQFGFDWRACDLEHVAQRHKQGGLLWNARVFSPQPRYQKYEHRPLLHWKAYDENATYRSRADAIVTFIAQVARTGNERLRLLDFGCGDGLFTWLLARAGFSATGIDIESEAIEQAKKAVAARPALAEPPCFFNGALDQTADDASFDIIVTLDVIEHLQNPVRHLKRLRTLLAPGGLLIVSTPLQQYGGWSDPVYHVAEYEQHELAAQIGACGFKVETVGRVSQPYRDVVVAARKESACA